MKCVNCRSAVDLNASSSARGQVELTLWRVKLMDYILFDLLGDLRSLKNCRFYKAYIILKVQRRFNLCLLHKFQEIYYYSLRKPKNQQHRSNLQLPPKICEDKRYLQSQKHGNFKYPFTPTSINKQHYHCFHFTHLAIEVFISCKFLLKKYKNVKQE